MKRLIAMAGLVSLCLGASVFAQKAAPPPPKPVILKPGKPLEKCVMLNTGQNLEYRFESSAKINFNLHYNKGDSVYYPVKLDRTTGEAGLYESRAREKHCFMWENRTDADVELTYSYKVGK